MRVLITGHHGYIGSILVPLLTDAGHGVIGLDTYLYEGCDFGADRAPAVAAIHKDVRDVTASDLDGFDGFDGFDAVIHLAALSNDPGATSTPTVPTPLPIARPSHSQRRPSRPESSVIFSLPRAASTAPPMRNGSTRPPASTP
jgi:hypothetical protein